MDKCCNFANLAETGYNFAGMKRPQYRRNNPKHRAVGAAPGGVGIAQVAEAAVYAGSVNHKDHPSFAGNPPRPRPDASICPRNLAGMQPQIQLWLSDAIRQGHFGGLWENGFPRYVWHREQGVIFEARHIGQGR
jgi:hypothetical protein